ncbi:MAG: cupin domain-containing protein [Desulfuromusa sp.]|jgi:transcriptional regulator with XRE-family HTH domain|nr:cupin domain-containing protein [Desulfuromusa sp.]
MNEFRTEVKELQIGQKIRELRQKLRMTLQDLSDSTELSKPLLSQIENDQVIPPLATLLRVAKALRAPLQTFFEEEDNTQKCLVVRADDAGRMNRRPSHGGAPQPYFYHSLAYGKKHKHMEPFLVEFDPAQTDQSQPVRHAGEEFFYILEGQIELKHGTETHILNAGDSVYWDSNEPHQLRALGTQIAHGIAVLYPRN